MRKLEPEHDPLIDTITNLKPTDVGENTADTQIPLDEEIASDREGRNVDVSKSGAIGKHSRNFADNHIEKPRRSDRLKRRHLVKKISCSSTTQQDHTPVLVKEMGGSCSSELEELKKENRTESRCTKPLSITKT